MRKYLREHENGFLFTQTILTVVGLFMTGYTLLSRDLSPAILLSLILYFLMVVYTCWGYKKPHGNYLKYLGLLLSVSIVVMGLTVVSPIEDQVAELFLGTIFDNFLSYLFILAAVGVAYVSGRLNKFKSNTFALIIVVVVLLIAVSYYQGVINDTLLAEKATQQTRFAVHLASYNPPILVATYGIAYLTRYEAHILAGEKDDLKLFKE